MQVSPATHRRVSIAALIALSVIIITGAAVRLTNSGLGCDDWPNCNSEKLIDVSSTHAAIEQVNRLFTGVVAVAVIAAVLVSYIRAPRRRDLIVLSWLLVAGVVANALLGAVTVWVDLHPYAVQGHLLLSLGLVVAGVVMVRRAGETDGGQRSVRVSRFDRSLAWMVAAGTTAAVLTGTVVTGAGPHAGDENAVRLDVSIPSVARLHGSSVIVTIAVAIVLARRVATRSSSRVLAPALSRWIFVALVQAVLGYTQYLTGVPAILVGLHVAGATAVTVASTLIVLDTYAPVVRSSAADNDGVVESRVTSGIESSPNVTPTS